MRPLPTHQHRLPARTLDRGTVRRFMSPCPRGISLDQTVESADELMRLQQARYLPVLEAGKLVGLVSERDAYLVRMIDPTGSKELPLERIMTQELFTVGPNDPISDVARAMVRGKYACAVVVDGATVCGTITSVDALRAILPNAPKAEP